MDKAYTAVFVLSFISATSGFFMVVVFTYIFVIPYRVSRERLFTQCLVTAFFKLHQSEHSNCTHVAEIGSISHAHNGSYCVGVKVMYKRLDTTWHYGVVSLGESNTNSLIGVTNSSFVPPCCPSSAGSCTVYNYQNSNASLNNNNDDTNKHRVPVYQQRTPTTMPSFKNTCHLKLHTETLQPVSLAQQFRCFYTEAQTLSRDMSESLPSHPVIVNIILWPTVLFICGFVGMFFSCIKMQYDQNSQRPQQQEQRSSGALL